MKRATKKKRGPYPRKKAAPTPVILDCAHLRALTSWCLEHQVTVSFEPWREKGERWAMWVDRDADAAPTAIALAPTLRDVKEHFTRTFLRRKP